MGETTIVSGSLGDPRGVPADTSIPRSPMSSPPSEDADELYRNQAPENVERTHEEGSDSGAENQPSFVSNCAISLICMLPDLTHPQIQIHQLHRHP